MNGFEVEILKFINSIFSHSILDKVFSFISFLGNKGAVWILITAILLIFPKTRKAGLCASLALIFCLVIGNGILKPLVDRARPYDFDNSLKIIIPKLKDGSFPSGHTMAAFAFASAVSLHFKKWAICVYSAASLMALSRLYLMVHYPTDVFFGVVFGLVFGFVSFKLTKRIKL